MGTILFKTWRHSFLLLATLFCGFNLCSALAFQITSVDFSPTGLFRVQHQADTNSYYVLYRGSTATNINTPVSLALGVGTSGQLSDTNLMGTAAFYRVQEVLQTQSLDLDGDGIADVYELNHPSCLDPLNPADAQMDCAGNGLTNIQVYLSQYQGLIINEVDYDQVGTDTGEFVELYNGSTNALHLIGFSLVFINGANNLEYLRTNFSGSLNPGQYLVVADNAVSVAPGAVVFRFSNTENNIQNGSPDGVVLFHVASNTILDAFSYEGPITNAVINGAPGTYNLVDGTPLATAVADSNTASGSLARLPNGSDMHNDSADWALSNNPTPGAANVP
jgi:Lamin Tail Domain